MLLKVTEVFYQDVFELDSFKKLVHCFDEHLELTSKAPNSLIVFLDRIFSSRYEGQDFAEVLDYTNRDKFMRRKREWLQKAKDGLDAYIESGKKGKGFYNHLVSEYTELIKAESEITPARFQRQYRAINTDKKMEEFKTELEEWRKDSSMMLYQYPFYDKLTKVQKNSALEVDMIMYIGNWLVERYDLVTYGDSSKEESKPSFLQQAPTTTVEDGWFGISQKTEYPLQPSENGDNKWIVPKKNGFETKSENRLAISPGAKLLSDRKISLKTLLEVKNDEVEFKSNGDGGIVKMVKTPDTKDSRIFIDILNRRGTDFKTNQSITVSLIDLVNTHYNGPSQWAYDDCVTRLVKLAEFSMMEKTKEGHIRYRTLISSMDIIRGNSNKNKDYGSGTNVTIVVSPQVYSNILQEECINVYNKEIQQLQNDLGYLLVFLLQKQRILNSDPKSNNNDIKFELHFDDFGVRMSKRSKKENFDEIEAALKEIQDKDFILKKFERDFNNRFTVWCYPLSVRELEDSVKLKLNLPELVK